MQKCGHAEEKAADGDVLSIFGVKKPKTSEKAEVESQKIQNFMEEQAFGGQKSQESQKPKTSNPNSLDKMLEIEELDVSELLCDQSLKFKLGATSGGSQGPSLLLSSKSGCQIISVKDSLSRSNLVDKQSRSQKFGSQDQKSF